MAVPEQVAVKVRFSRTLPNGISWEIAYANSREEACARIIARVDTALCNHFNPQKGEQDDAT